MVGPPEGARGGPEQFSISALTMRDCEGTHDA
ncbi:hypothetical protein VTH06DRAFT_3739 [Thermothelomyces fergusii]